MNETLRLIDFEACYQAAVADLINTGLGEHFGFVDKSKNPDLFDIASSYEDADFLVALVSKTVVGTGALITHSSEMGQVVRMHTAKQHRRGGVASNILFELERRARQNGLKTLWLETNIDWEDAISFYLRKGYVEFARNEVGIRFQKNLLSVG